VVGTPGAVGDEQPAGSGRGPVRFVRCSRPPDKQNTSINPLNYRCMMPTAYPGTYPLFQATTAPKRAVLTRSFYLCCPFEHRQAALDLTQHGLDLPQTDKRSQPPPAEGVDGGAASDGRSSSRRVILAKRVGDGMRIPA
jgi:hypothetical protein